MNITIKHAVAGLALLALSPTLTAQASSTITWDFNWTGTQQDTFTGTLTTADTLTTVGGNTGYPIIGMTGVWDNKDPVTIFTITSLGNVGDRVLGHTVDNLLLTNGTNGIVDPNGVGFYFAGRTTIEDAIFGSGSEVNILDNSGNYEAGTTWTAIATTPVPEPSLLALSTLSGFGGLLMFRRRK